MRSFRLLFQAVFFSAIVLAFTFPMWTQQTPQPALQDPQAVSIVSQAVRVVGGLPAITAIIDYTATGSITYRLAQDVQGGVTVRGNWFDKFRVDAQLPTGVRSEAISSGQISTRFQDGTILQPQGPAPLCPSKTLLPYLLLVPALQSHTYGLSYKGIVQENGQPAHDIQLQLLLPGMNDPNSWVEEYVTVDFFIDTSTLQVVMMQDVVPNHLVRQIQFSDYRLAGGVLVPYSIKEQVAGRSTQQIQLDNITFNTGLQDSDFQL